MQAASLKSSIRDCKTKVKQVTKRAWSSLVRLWPRIWSALKSGGAWLRAQFKKNPSKYSIAAVGLPFLCYALGLRYLEPERSMVFTAFPVPAQMPADLQISGIALSNRLA